MRVLQAEANRKSGQRRIGDFVRILDGPYKLGIVVSLSQQNSTDGYRRVSVCELGNQRPAYAVPTLLNEQTELITREQAADLFRTITGYEMDAP
jgi:hypothetical protein